MLQTIHILVAITLACPWRTAAFQIQSFACQQRMPPTLLGLRSQVVPFGRLFDEEDVNGELEKLDDVWAMRENMIRSTLKSLAAYKLVELEIAEDKAANADGEGASTAAEKTKSAVVTSAVAVVLGAAVLRLGGRAALVSLLGLDFVAEMGVGDQIDQYVTYAQEAGPLALVAFLLAWVAAKVFLLDFLSVALALSSGVVFGGVLQGALLSSLGATLGSLVGFQLSRSVLREKVEGALEKQPVARALQRVVEEDGFKTVFVLRIAPVIPIPLGGYSYIYGSSRLALLPFCSATFLGGLKPYLLDSYLGVFSKQLIDGGEVDSTRDALLLVGLFTLVLVGVFANDLAGEVYECVLNEVKAEKDAKALARANRNGLDGLGGAAGEEEEDDEPLFDLGALLPFDPNKVVAAVVPLVAREEVSAVFGGLTEFARGQWPDSLAAAEDAQSFTKARAKEDEAEAAALKAAEASAWDIAKVRARRKKESKGNSYAPPDYFERSGVAQAAEARRRAAAEWTLAGPQPARPILASVLFTFALAKVFADQWNDFPGTE
mmetsp:Transcript_71524/g.140417  ORF Transcript_71524/g.140417 Transcript_71524/m.140417 type:complete len:548 (-) Transcript_71524:182-1825(-)